MGLRPQTSDLQLWRQYWCGADTARFVPFAFHFLVWGERRVGYRGIQVQVKGGGQGSIRPRTVAGCDNLTSAWQLSRCDQLAAQTDFRQVHPAVLLVFPHEA
jgi:hypothetical protein